MDLDPSSFTFLWQKTLSSTLALNPVTAADGKVFVSLDVYFNTGAAFFAMDAGDGTELWSKDFGSVHSVNPPSYGDGKV